MLFHQIHKVVMICDDHSCARSYLNFHHSTSFIICNFAVAIWSLIYASNFQFGLKLSRLHVNQLCQSYISPQQASWKSFPAAFSILCKANQWSVAYSDSRSLKIGLFILCICLDNDSFWHQFYMYFYYQLIIKL